MISAKKEANNVVTRLHMYNVQSSKRIKMYQLRLRLADLILQWKTNRRKTKLKTVSKLAITTGRKWWISLDPDYLIWHKVKVRKIIISPKEAKFFPEIYVPQEQTHVNIGDRQLVRGKETPQYSIYRKKWENNPVVLDAYAHRWWLPVLCYHKIMVIYPYPFLVAINLLFSWIIFIYYCICLWTISPE